MNILYDNQIFVQQKYGGISRLFYELIKHLSQREGVNVILFQGFHVNHFPLADLRDRMAFYFGKRIRPLPYTAKILRIFNTVLFDLFKPHKKIDIFHPTDYSPVVSRWKKSPLVVTVYDMIFELYPHFFKDMDIKSRIQRKKKCIERASRIITISNSTKNDLLSFYNGDEKKVRVIYPGAPPPGDDEIPGRQRQNNITAGKKPFILYVGMRKRGYKNFKNLLTAFASNKKINREFDLLCFGGGSFTPGEMSLISQVGVRDHVFQESGNDEKLHQLYKNARVFVYPSLYEGFGLPPLEAMVYGCPVIAGHVAALPEVLGEAAVYFDPHEPGSIADALENVLFSDSKAQELVKKGFIKARQYSWSKMAGETYQLYSEVVSS